MKQHDASKNIKILYTFVQRRSFVATDLRRLENFYTLSSYRFPSNKKYMLPWLLIKQGIFLLIFGWRYHYFVSFFAGYHSILPTVFARLFKKKSVIFLGGTDCFNYPSFKYGNFTKKWYGMATCISAQNATMLVPVSANLIRTESLYYKNDSIIQGIYHWCPGLHTPYRIVPTEYDPNVFFRWDIERVKNSFMTIAFDIKGVSFIRKGIDKVIMIANAFPDFRFTIVGCDEKDFPAKVPLNVKLVPPIPHSEVPGYLSAHEFYLQLSIAEGLPNAVCEAMLCECIVIGSEVAAIPEAIGDNGFIIKERNDELIIEVVKKAVAYEGKVNMGKNARQHIITKYGPGTRMDSLREIFV